MKFAKNTIVVLGIGLIYLIPSTLFAAVAFDTSGGFSITNGGGYTNLTLDASSTILLGSVYYNPNSRTINTPTWNGNNLTLVDSVRLDGTTPAPDSGGLNNQLWYILNPDTGTHTLSVTDSANRPLGFSASSYSGVDSIGNSGVGGSTSYGDNEPSITTTATGAWLVMGVTGNDSMTPLTGTTARDTRNSANEGIYDSSGAVSVGSNSLGTNNSNNNGSSAVIAELRPIIITPYVTGSGTVNRIAKFNNSSSITNSILGDDGSNLTLTLGNFFIPAGSSLDSAATGTLNFGTSAATTMTFGRSGQNVIINSRVGISTTSPIADLSVNGGFFANFINILADGLGIDTFTPGLLSIGSSTATSINIGRSGVTTTIMGGIKTSTMSSTSNCNSSASPATCGSSVAGSVSMATGGDTLTVNTSAVTANSQIFVMEDSSLDSRLGVTCNTAGGRTYVITNRSAGTSFTIKASKNITANPACFSYFIVN